MLVEQVLYTTLFLFGSFLVKPIKERFAIYLSTFLMTLCVYLNNYFDRDGGIVLPLFAFVEVIGAVLLPLLISGYRSFLIFTLQVISASYFMWEYLTKGSTLSWEYYEIIQIVLLELTFAVYIFKLNKKENIILYFLYSLFLGVSWYFPGYLSTYL